MIGVGPVENSLSSEQMLFALSAAGGVFLAVLLNALMWVWQGIKDVSSAVIITAVTIISTAMFSDLVMGPLLGLKLPASDVTKMALARWNKGLVHAITLLYIFPFLRIAILLCPFQTTSLGIRLIRFFNYFSVDPKKKDIGVIHKRLVEFVGAVFYLFLFGIAFVILYNIIQCAIRSP